MSHVCDTSCQEPFNSFLAGLFLTRRNICNLELFQLMNDFENKYGVFIDGEQFDLSLDIGSSDIKLIEEYDDIIILNKTKITVKDYLFNIASDRVKEFFDLQPKTKKLSRVMPVVFSKKGVKEYI